jgi:PPM family protein phosphatase
MPQPQQDSPNLRVTIQAMTDVGRVRTHNEDNFIVCPDLGEKRWYVSDQPHPLSPKGCLLVVADGMGGTNAGEVASEIAVETIRRQFDGLPQLETPGEQQAYERLQQAILAAHQDIVEAALANPAHAGMGTTLVMAWVFPHKAFIGWVGDSRAYRYQKEGGLQLLTDDHSLVWEMVKAGTLTPEEADVHPNSNIITQSLGNGNQPPAPEFTSCALAPGDRLLLCSDGLNNMVSHKAMEKIFGAETALEATCRELIQWANDEGGADNITVLCLEADGKTAKKNFFNLFGFLSL